jgi:hypothetical protein
MWAAESSLNKRKRDLGALVEAHEIAQSRIPDHAGWVFMHPGDYDYDQFLNMESHSIMANDLFARELVPDLNWDTPVPSDNPFAKFLQQLVKDLPDDCSFQGWEPEFGPDYRICESGALDLVGGDIKAANYLLNGRVGLHEIPSEVRSSGAKCIADWIVDVGVEREAAANAALQEWRAKLSDKHQKVFDSIDRTIENSREQAK